MTTTPGHLDIHDHIEQLVEHHTHREPSDWPHCRHCPTPCLPDGHRVGCLRCIEELT